MLFFVIKILSKSNDTLTPTFPNMAIEIKLTLIDVTCSIHSRLEICCHGITEIHMFFSIPTLVLEVKTLLFEHMCLVAQESTTHWLTLVTRFVLEKTVIIISFPLVILPKEDCHS